MMRRHGRERGQAMEITRRLAEFVVQTGYADLPDEAVTQAKRATLDTLGVGLAGTVEPCARIAAEVVREEGGRPVATVIGQGFAAPVRAAALVNGTAIHALDYDDVTASMHGHPSPPLLPALLAAGEEMGADGRALIEAFVLGFEVECKVGRGLGASHYPHGWHATSTLGTLGAAVVAGKLYGLTIEQMIMALGIAASLASGSRQNFGTMTKPLHPGAAASAGILAAQLARRGFTADETILEAPLGFINLFSPARDATPERVLVGLGDPYEIVSPGISVKKYPCCFVTHNALDALLALRGRHGFSADQIERITVSVPGNVQASARAGATSADEAAPVTFGPLIHARPTTGLEAKFSMQYCMAAAALGGSPVLDTFEDDAVQRPAAQSLLRRVAMAPFPEGDMWSGGTEVAVTLTNGTTVRDRCSEPRGGPSQPLSWDELAAKYRDCAARVIGEAAAAESLALIADLERPPSTSTLMRLVSGQAAAITA
jgi:2-methylcitrate dehydratase PrpD